MLLRLQAYIIQGASGWSFFSTFVSKQEALLFEPSRQRALIILFVYFLHHREMLSYTTFALIFLEAIWNHRVLVTVMLNSILITDKSELITQPACHFMHCFSFTVQFSDYTVITFAALTKP